MSNAARRVVVRLVIMVSLGLVLFSATPPTASVHAAGYGAAAQRSAKHVNYICCYTGKGYDVLFIHGISGSSSINCGKDPSQKGDWVNTKQYLLNHQWVGNLVTLGYYYKDYNCDDYIFYNHGDLAKCNGYYNSDIGDNNEDDRHLACELAWYIWDQYTVNTWSVDVVAFSLGGVILKEALYQIHQGNTHFPAYLLIPHAVIESSPLLGLPSLPPPSWFVCGGCVEIAEIGKAQDVYQDLNQPAALTVQAFGGTQWTLEAASGLFCDIALYTYGINTSDALKFEYQVVPGLNSTACAVGTNQYTYLHGGTLFDTNSNYDAQALYCTGCNGAPTTSTSGLPHSIQVVYNSLTGNCLASPSIDNCDGDDPDLTGCSNGAYVLGGGDPSYLNMYWSPACSTNYANVGAPSGYLATVTIARSNYSASWCNASSSNSTTCWNNADRHFIYCSKDWTNNNCPSDTWYYFGKYTTGWITDMLYAPTEAVQVRITTSAGGSYSSHWH